MINQTTPYLYTCFVPFYLADPASVVFFGHAFTLFHQAFESFVIHRLQCPWTFWFQHPEWIVPIKQAEAEYLHPMRAGQDCLIELIVSSVSTSSFALTSSFYQDQLCCLVKTVHIFCDRFSRKAIPIPPFDPLSRPFDFHFHAGLRPSDCKKSPEYPPSTSNMGF